MRCGQKERHSSENVFDYECMVVGMFVAVL